MIPVFVQKHPYCINCKIQKEMRCLKWHFLAADNMSVICRVPYDKWFYKLTIFFFSWKKKKKRPAIGQPYVTLQNTPTQAPLLVPAGGVTGDFITKVALLLPTVFELNIKIQAKLNMKLNFLRLSVLPQNVIHCYCHCQWRQQRCVIIVAMFDLKKWNNSLTSDYQIILHA